MSEQAVATATCTKCGEEKPLAEAFFARVRRKGKRTRRWSRRCRVCVAQQGRDRRLARGEPARKPNRESETRRRANGKRMAYHRRVKYGLSEVDHRLLTAYQRGLCAGCGTDPTGMGLQVDHDHKTGLVRGLLCWRCNRTLGFALDDPQRLRALADFLEEPPAMVIKRGEWGE